MSFNFLQCFIFLSMMHWQRNSNLKIFVKFLGICKRQLLWKVIHFSVRWIIIRFRCDVLCRLAKKKCKILMERNQMTDMMIIRKREFSSFICNACLVLTWCRYLRVCVFSCVYVCVKERESVCLKGVSAKRLSICIECFKLQQYWRKDNRDEKTFQKMTSKSLKKYFVGRIAKNRAKQKKLFCLKKGYPTSMAKCHKWQQWILLENSFFLLIPKNTF